MAESTKNNEWSKYFSGSFLLRELWLKNLPFLLYVLLLCILAINASHSAERKAHEIARLSTKHKELKSEYIDTKSTLMQMSSETRVIERAEALGLEESTVPPKKLTPKDE
ncbi:MAG: hypothetical protein SchgKO_11440 [Schleiferiaceae bacterium]|jgi:hypothetical protein